uniref:STAS domain-containing protein n=1 Tax=Eubacterium cellulosolvens TaxID=29322 RepID=UPI0006855F0D|nr:STAS domain-containing protein [[Eubacterium] cellulosolvens]
MIIEKKQNNGEFCLILSGRIDTTTSPQLREKIAEIPDEAERLILDFKDVEYISSAGLRELLVCRQRFREERMLISTALEKP